MHLAQFKNTVPIFFLQISEKDAHGQVHFNCIVLFWPWPSIWPWLHYSFHFGLVSETVLFNIFSKQFQRKMHKGNGKLKTIFITFWPWTQLFHARSLWSLTCLADPNFYINLHFLYISHHDLARAIVLKLCKASGYHIKIFLKFINYEEKNTL